MFTHATLGANDVAASRTFYDAALGALGIAPGEEDSFGRIVYLGADSRLLVMRPRDGEAAEPGNGHTLGLAAASPAAVDAWFAAGLAHGGTAIEDPPGVRERPDGRRLYLAYLRDPAGNKLCAQHRIA